MAFFESTLGALVSLKVSIMELKFSEIHLKVLLVYYNVVPILVVEVVVEDLKEVEDLDLVVEVVDLAALLAFPVA